MTWARDAWRAMALKIATCEDLAIFWIYCVILPYFAHLGWSNHLLELPGGQWHMFATLFACQFLLSMPICWNRQR
jgi:hypothetical protein